MDTFWDTETYNKQFMDLVQFRVTAYNVNGWGESSEPNTDGATVRTAPRFMNPPLRNPTTNDKQMFVYWEPISSYEETGGSEIVSYGLQWDAGTSGVTWSDLEGYMVNMVKTEFTASQIDAGSIYQFRLQARNIYGWGDFSTPKSIAAAGIPEQMSIPSSASQG